MRLEGKTAIVTGAGSGMGAAIAKLYAEEGANVVASDINEESLTAIIEEIKESGGQAVSLVSNVAVQKDIDELVALSLNEYGSLDILVNNAGIVDNFVTVGDVSDELWDRVISINLTGAFKLCRAAINIMETQETGGVIINNASVGGLFGTRGGASYAASKHGLIGLTKNIAATYGVYGKVRCNAIAPGGVATNIQKTIDAPSPLGYKALKDTGYAPTADPKQIAQIAVFLASDESSFVNGDVLKADGGWTAR
ncbi:MAG TPA: SDR family oxidoreductase [Candidatus Tetragenococcus pullicola]|nr:SDR family oxidoreductase [Candidatus Tetragenococcus pullicola]